MISSLHSVTTGLRDRASVLVTEVVITAVSSKIMMTIKNINNKNGYDSDSGCYDHGYDTNSFNLDYGKNSNDERQNNNKLSSSLQRS